MISKVKGLLDRSQRDRRKIASVGGGGSGVHERVKKDPCGTNRMYKSEAADPFILSLFTNT